MKKLSAVFWDVDGTIADTEIGGHRLAFNLAFKDFKLDWNWSKKTYIELLKISGGLNRIIHYRNDQNIDVNDYICSKIQSRKRFHYHKIINSGKIKPREGVLRLIKELGNNNIKQFIVTTSGKESLLPFLNTALNKHVKYFSELITYESVSKHKPYPDAYELAIKLSGNSAANCLAIEDSTIGVESAKRAKLNCLRTLPPWDSYAVTNNKNANACVDKLGSIMNSSTIVYGKPLISSYVDLNYLKYIMN